MDFWPSSDVEETLRRLTTAIEPILGSLQTSYRDSELYRSLASAQGALSPDPTQQKILLESLIRFLRFYALAFPKEADQILLRKIQKRLEEARRTVSEHVAGLAAIANRKRDLTQGEQKQKDTETIERVGIFYILELTVYLLSLFPGLSEQDRLDALYKGIKTENGNMPSYAQSKDGFRRDLCYNILEDGLRTRLLEAFFVFEEAFDRREAPAVFEAFKTWNLELLRAFKDTGVSLFKTKILSSSFGQEIPMDELIKRVESIPLA